MPDWVKDVSKAFAGSILAGLTSAATALADDGVITKQEWVVIAIAFVGVWYGVWQTPDSMSPMRKALKNSQR